MCAIALAMVGTRLVWCGRTAVERGQRVGRRWHSHTGTAWSSRILKT